MRKRVKSWARRLLISRVQLKILGYAVFFSAVTSIFACYLMKMAMNMEGGFSFPFEFWFLIAGGLILFIGLLVIGLLLTNQICGPLYRLQNEIQEMTHGATPSKVVVRKHDEFKDLINDFNELVERLARK